MCFIISRTFCVVFFSVFCSQSVWNLSPGITVMWSLLPIHQSVLWAFLEKQYNNKTYHIWLSHAVKCYFCSFWCFLISKPHFVPIIASTWLLLLIFPSPLFLPYLCLCTSLMTIAPEAERGKPLEMSSTLPSHNMKPFHSICRWAYLFVMFLLCSGSICFSVLNIQVPITSKGKSSAHFLLNLGSLMMSVLSSVFK